MSGDENFLMRGLLHAYYWADESLQNHLRAEGWPAVSRTQSMIMVNVADGVTRPADLARHLGISRQAVQQLLADMEERGLVQLRPDLTDARAKIVEFSRRGEGIGSAARAALRNMDAELERRLGRDAYRQLKQTLLHADWGPVMDPGATRTARRPMPRRGRVNR